MPQAPEMKILITGDASQGLEALRRFAEEVNKGSKKVEEMSETIAQKGTRALHTFGEDLLKAGATFGSVAGLSSMMADKVVEGLREIVNYVPEAIESTNKLSEAFKDLRITAGLSVEEFNEFLATSQLSGGTVQDVTEIVSGMQKGIKANSEVLIANGIATDKTALSHMTLGQYVHRVVEVMEEMGSATDKDQLLMAAFGRSGMALANKVVELNENFKEGQEIAKRGAPINAQSIQNLEEHEKAVGRLNLALQRNKSMTAEAYSPISNAYTNWRAGAVSWSNDSYEAMALAQRGLIQYRFQSDGVSIAIGKMIEDMRRFKRMQQEANEDRAREELHAKNVSASKEVRTFKSADDLKPGKENTFQSDMNRLLGENLRTRQSVVLAERQRNETLLAGNALDAERLQIAKGLKDGSLTAQQAAKLRAQAEQNYTDQAIAIDTKYTTERVKLYEGMQARLSGQEQGGLAKRLAAIAKEFAAIREENAKLGGATSEADIAAAERAAQGRARVDQVKEDLGKLKEELSQLAQDKGGLTEMDRNQVLARYASAGGTQADAAARYRQEQHIGEGALAGVEGGMNTFLAEQGNAWKQWQGATVNVIGGVHSGLSSMFSGMVLEGGSAMGKLGAFTRGFGTLAVKTLADMGAKELTHWAILKAKAAWKAMTTATEIGQEGAKSAARVAGAATSAGAAATEATASGVATGANVGKATSGFFAAFSGIPFVGLALALAAIATMMAVMKQITGRAVGGRVDRPEITLLGEAGPEIVAPEANFLDWAHAHQNLGYNLAAHQAQISRLNAQAGSYASDGLSRGGGLVGGGPYNDLRGATVITMDDSQWGRAVNKGLTAYKRSNG